MESNTPTHLSPLFAVVGIGAKAAESIEQLRKLCAAYDDYSYFTFLHITSKADSDLLPKTNLRMAVLLFDADESEDLAAHIALSFGGKVSLRIGIMAGCQHVDASKFHLDSLEYIGCDTSRWLASAMTVLSPMLAHCMTSFDFHELCDTLGDTTAFRTWRSGEHRSITEAIGTMNNDKCSATLQRSSCIALFIYAAPQTLAAIKSEELNTVNDFLNTATKGRREKAETHWGIYNDTTLPTGVYRTELITAGPHVYGQSQKLRNSFNSLTP